MNSIYKTIRYATYRDAPAIKLLLEGCTYSPSLSTLIHQLEMSFGQQDHQVWVCETKRDVVGFVVIHFLPQLTSEHPNALVSVLLVDKTAQEHGIDKLLEEFITEECKKRKCGKVALCATCQEPDRRLYLQQGYLEYPMYFIKELVYEK